MTMLMLDTPTPTVSRRPTNDDLLATFQRNGDSSCLAELHRRETPRIRSLLTGVGVADADLEDLVQETFLKICTSIGHYNPERPAKSWISRIAQNVAHDHHRRSTCQRRRSPSAITGQLIEDHVYRPATGDDDVVERNQLARDDGGCERNEQNQLVRDAVAKLPDNQRVIVELLYFDGLAISDVSIQLDLPIGTVKSRLNRGLTRLKETLGPLVGERDSDCCFPTPRNLM